MKATNFLFSLLIVVAAFAAGRYAFPTSSAPAAAPEEIAVKTTETPVVSRADSPVAGSISAEDALAYTPSELHTIRLFENASPSVCYITTKTQRRSFWTRDVSEVPAGSGSGFVWDNQGHIITNYHVIRDASRAIVTLANGEDYDAKLVGIAKEKDLAVLRIEAPAGALEPIPVGTSQDIRVGQAVYAIGNPFGLDQTLTTGVVSALDREINSQANVPIRGVIQSDAAINPGNSGGPLLDSRGMLIGVNTAIYSPSGASAGIGFSIPVDVVRYVVPDLIRYGEVRRASLGVDFYRYWRGTGLAIEEVVPQGPAGSRGVRGLSQDARGNWVLGDVLVGINGKAIKTSTDYFLEMENFEPGERVTLNLVRDERRIEVEVELGSSVE
ncbi:S1C family serine protease [Neolewinella aurantiaca]|uniref:S1C family serine protease n=1 Tax=Neolewinella aurantiaca TaxID=2602767 RepID=UPI001FEB12EA|nr:trypsin-like peptidase domain-containing protein [Neolewinella aurantiaca]